MALMALLLIAVISKTLIYSLRLSSTGMSHLLKLIVTENCWVLIYVGLPKEPGSEFNVVI